MMYFIQDKTTLHGSSVVWRSEEGFTSNIVEAKLFTDEEAQGICLRRKYKAWPKWWVEGFIKKGRIVAISIENLKEVDV